MNYIRITDGKIDGAIVKVQPGFVLNPALVQVVDDPVPAFSSATHKARFGNLVLEGGGTWVRRTWIVEPKTAEELAEDSERAQIQQMLNGIDAALAKLDANTATIGEVRGYMSHVLRFIKRFIKTQGIP